MILSVIIVNYNVKYFLEQCLYSVEKALRELDSQAGGAVPGPETTDLETEIFVVDNHSSDGSIEYLRSAFPQVKFIVNDGNLGFARANNQALREARGENILFLNPDTILPEDFFNICLSFMRTEPRAGALGTRMIDGSGRFLKESRRGFPSPWVAFCKLTGLTALFPHSRLFANYYLGHLPSDRNHPAPILSGACLWARRDALDKTGSFDEQFFMYAEDIDLSHRIEQAGYINYYLADTTILHFKGESTRKDARYVKLFYKAMSQFRQKHFSGGLSALFNVLIECAIWLRAGVTTVASLVSPARWKRGKGTRTATPPIYRTRVTGDPDGVERLTAVLSSAAGRQLVPDGQETEEIIFCEGPAFRFSDCIAALQKIRGRVSCKIHAAGSGSAAGSHSKEEQGQTIVLP
ncbi:MAG TPA: glycosyltransferase family 2 protein [Puia sp.]|nr:glycosyltransferase family 2 protein [Puia sp.]